MSFLDSIGSAFGSILKPVTGILGGLAPIAGTLLGGRFGGPMGAQLGGGLGGMIGNLLGGHGGGQQQQAQAAPAQQQQAPQQQAQQPQMGMMGMMPQMGGMGYGQQFMPMQPQMGGYGMQPQGMGLGQMLGSMGGDFMRQHIAPKFGEWGGSLMSSLYPDQPGAQGFGGTIGRYAGNMLANQGGRFLGDLAQQGINRFLPQYGGMRFGNPLPQAPQGVPGGPGFHSNMRGPIGGFRGVPQLPPRNFGDQGDEGIYGSPFEGARASGGYHRYGNPFAGARASGSYGAHARPVSYEPPMSQGSYDPFGGLDYATGGAV